MLLLALSTAFAFWSGSVQDQIISQDDNMMGWYTRMAVDGDGIIHTVWNERIVNFPSQQEIHYSRTSDNGYTWSAMAGDVVISYNDGINAENGAGIAVDSDNNLYVVWGEKTPSIKEIHYTISTDGGATWSGQSGDQILSLPGGADALNPDIVIDASNAIHVVWNQDDIGGIDEIHYSRSTNGGVTWSPETIISFADGQSSGFPDIAVDPVTDYLYVVWQEPDDTDPTLDVMNVSISTDGGDTWSGIITDVSVTLPFRILSHPHVSIDALGRIHAIWKGTVDTSSPFHYEVYYSRSLDGVIWSGLSEQRFISYYQPGDPSVNIPNIGVDSQGSVMVVWDEDYLGDDNEIFTSSSTDGGDTWTGETQNDIISFPDDHPAYRPFIVAGLDDTLHVTWNEVTSTSYYQIHYSRGDALGSVPPDVTISLVPENPPIQIPASGGSFNFNATITNNTASPQTFDVWIMVTLPNGSPYGPVLGPVNLTLPPAISIERTRTQLVPATAPTGMYTYQGYVGNYPGGEWSSDSFAFEKLTTGDGSVIGDWTNYGEEICWAESSILPTTTELICSYPNPFNPATTINFTLAEAGKVTMSVYNVSGRKVTDLIDGWRDAGTHEVFFEASDLPSGIYIHCLTAGKYSATGKMVLMK
jgi:hypothetical protein